MSPLSAVLLVCLALFCVQTEARSYYHNRNPRVLRMESENREAYPLLTYLRNQIYRNYNNGYANRRVESDDNNGAWMWALLMNQFGDGANIPALAGQLGLNTLVSAVKKAGLVDTLSGDGPFTVFGPTDQAFASVPGWVKMRLGNTTFLQEVLKYHVLSGEVKSSSITNDLVANTVQGMPIRFNIYKGNTVYTAQCAPIDLKKVDQVATNGVIHVINSVMIPPAGNIVASLARCPAYKTLVKLVKVANLVDTLSGAGPFTLFAPSDKAFAKLPESVVNDLINHPDKLAKVLTYHVVSGTNCKAGLDSGSIPTVNGASVQVTVSSGGVTVNDAHVVYADASVTNGVIHAIDTVLLPPDLTL